jgi:hypothetical protein
MRRSNRINIVTLVFALCGCRPASVTLDTQYLAPLRAHVEQEISRLVSEWQARQVDNLKYRTNEFPKTSPEEIRKEVSIGVEYVVARIKGRQPVLVLTSEIEYSQLHPTFTSLDNDKVNLTYPFNPEFRLSFETYEESLSSAAMGYQRFGRSLALRWFYSRKIYPVNRLK